MNKKQLAGQKGGLRTLELYGSEHFSKIGKEGLKEAVKKYPDFHQKGGYASFASQQDTNEAYPNQKGYWNR